MNCRDVIERLNEYVDGDLPEEERRAIQSHAAACRACAAELEQLNSLLSLAASLPRSIEPPHDLWDGIAEKIDTLRNGARTRATGRSPVPPAQVFLPDARSVPRGFIYRQARNRILAIAAMVIVIIGAYLVATNGPDSSWNGAILTGIPAIGTERLAEHFPLVEGTYLETDGSSRAEISNAMVGTVGIEPNTRLKLISKGHGEHRFALERGTIRASTWVPPRVFVVELPSAVAVDLGCEYRLTVDDSGGSCLLVTAGWVALAWNEREVVIPATAFCRTRPGTGPGTPYSEYASDTLKQALEQFDFRGGGAAALDVVLTHSRKHDAVTLWHLISRVNEEERPRVADRLAALVPVPAGTTREGVLRLNDAML